MQTFSNMPTSYEKRRTERGAALITALMVSMLLLIAGGALILTTSLSATNAIDSTAETQAYYAAEAGLQAALNVLRGKGTPTPSGTITLDFRKAITLDSNNYSNRSGDPSTVPRLSRWLSYTVNGDYTSANSRVSVGNNSSYTVEVYDPDGTLPVTEKPDRLLVIVKGYGPKGSKKELRMFVSRMGYDIPVPAPIVIRGADDGTSTMTFNLGDSNASDYTGVDAAGLIAERPTLVVSYLDRHQAAIALNDGPTIGNEQLGILDYNASPNGTAFTPPTYTDSSTWLYGTAPAQGSHPAVNVAVKNTTSTPDFLVSADAARAFLTRMETLAKMEDRYYTSLNGYAGSYSPYTPLYTFVDGNCNLDGGAGLLIVTGDLVLNGGVNFKGLILVLGNGRVTKSGGGGSDEFGSFMVARFARTWPSSENGQSHPFLAPFFDVSGSGNSSIQSHSQVEEEAKETTGRIVLGIAEK
jgi:Tfp pilus assembly protein PilX